MLPVQNLPDKCKSAADHSGQQHLDVGDDEASTFDSALDGDPGMRVHGVAEQRFGMADVDDQAGEVGFLVREPDHP